MTSSRQSATEAEARLAYAELHRRPSYGYERGDCHCQDCEERVDQLVGFFDITQPATGLFDPARVIRSRAQRRWGLTT